MSLSLSRKQVVIFLLVLVAFLVALAASMAILRAANPGVWQSVQQNIPNVMGWF